VLLKCDPAANGKLLPLLIDKYKVVVALRMFKTPTKYNDLLQVDQKISVKYNKNLTIC
jgi:hypothetical protein